MASHIGGMDHFLDKQDLCWALEPCPVAACSYCGISMATKGVLLRTCRCCLADYYCSKSGLLLIQFDWRRKLCSSTCYSAVWLVMHMLGCCREPLSGAWEQHSRMVLWQSNGRKIASHNTLTDFAMIARRQSGAVAARPCRLLIASLLTHPLCALTMWGIPQRLCLRPRQRLHLHAQPREGGGMRACTRASWRTMWLRRWWCSRPACAA